MTFVDASEKENASLSSGRQTVTLTDKRIYCQTSHCIKIGGLKLLVGSSVPKGADYEVVNLRNVTAANIQNRNNSRFLLGTFLAAIATFFMFYLSSTMSDIKDARAAFISLGVFTILLAILFLVLFFLFRRLLIVIEYQAGKSGEMVFLLKGANATIEEGIAFVGKVMRLADITTLPYPAPQGATEEAPKASDKREVVEEERSEEEETTLSKLN